MKRRILIFVLATMVLAGALFFYTRFTDRQAQFTVVSNGPLNIRLWGIRPDGGDTIYDLKGKKIMDCMGAGLRDEAVWSEDTRRCDFLFELPDTNEIPLFVQVPLMSVSGEDIRLLWVQRGSFNLDPQIHVLAYKGKKLLCVEGRFSRTFGRWAPLRLWYRDNPVERIDIELSYYHGPMGPAEFVLKGPFEPGTTRFSENKRNEVLFKADEKIPWRRSPNLEWLGAGLPSKPVFAYDNKGVRHRLYAKNPPRPDSNTVSMIYQNSGISLDSIAAISFNEPPHRIRFKNINIGIYPDSHEDHAAWLDEMAKRLALVLPATELERYKFKDAKEAIKVADIVRGWKVREVAEIIRKGGIGEGRAGSTRLTEDQIRVFRQTAWRWSQTIEPWHREYGVEIGLRCGWPEFVEPALRLLDYPVNYTYCGYGFWNGPLKMGHALWVGREHLSDEALEHVKNKITSRPHPGSFAYLKACLLQTDTENRLKTVFELARDDRPWLWYDAVATLLRLSEFKAEMDSHPEKLQVRAFIVGSPRYFSNAEEIRPKAYRLLPDLLTPELRNIDSGVFSNLLRIAAKKLDHDTTTRAMIGYIRHIENHRNDDMYIDRIVRYINSWYGVNIGGLGPNIRKPTENRYKIDWSKIAAEAIAWYDNEFEPADSNSAD